MRMIRLQFFTILLLFLSIGLSACAARNGDAPEPEVKVRGQYDISIGTVR